MSNNVDVGGVATRTVQTASGHHVQMFIPVETDPPVCAAVPVAATSTTLSTAKAAPLVRRKLLIYNNSNGWLYIRFGGAADYALFSIAIAPTGAYELSEPCSPEVINGIWAAPPGGVVGDLTGGAMVTEWTTTGTL